MSKDKRKLTLADIQKAKKPKETTLPKKVKLKDLEKFSKTVRFPIVWREEIESHIDYPIDLSSFIVEAIKEKMERENMKTFIG